MQHLDFFPNDVDHSMTSPRHQDVSSHDVEQENENRNTNTRHNENLVQTHPRAWHPY